MLYLQYACDMMTSQVLCPVAINKYYQGAEKCFSVQSTYIQVVNFFEFFILHQRQHRKKEDEVNRWYHYGKVERAETGGISSLKNDS
jgi:hypothetical protein